MLNINIDLISEISDNEIVKYAVETIRNRAARELRRSIHIGKHGSKKLNHRTKKRNTVKW